MNSKTRTFTVAVAFLALTLAFAPGVSGQLVKQGPSANVPSARDLVEGILKAQAAAWNRGDLDTFCSVYASDATFISPRVGITTGKQAILERYRTGYPSTAAHDTLSFELVEVRDLRCGGVSGGTISLIARWRLVAPDASVRTGLTLLVFRAIPGGLELVQDASL
jgi:ketosteroid isomerase-like protein